MTLQSDAAQSWFHKGTFLAATRLVSEVKRVILTSRAIYYLENNPNRINTGLVKVEIILKII